MDPVTASIVTQAVIASLRAITEIAQRPANDEEIDAIIAGVVGNSQALVRANTARLRQAIDSQNDASA